MERPRRRLLARGRRGGLIPAEPHRLPRRLDSPVGGDPILAGMRVENLTGIGEFARRTRLSVKQLRNYDELGLLAPAYVDPDSGYRYYHPRQARTAITIALLRSLDLPLAEIHAALVADPEQAGAIIGRQRGVVEERVERDLQILRSLDRLLGAEDLLAHEVELRQLPSIELIGLRRTCAATELDSAATGALDELFERLPSPEARAQAATGLYPLDLEGEVEFFVGVELGSNPVGPPLERASLPATPAATTVHTGPPGEIRLAYFPLLAHLHERSIDPVGPVRETYLAAPPEVPAERAVTEVALPYVAPDPRQR